MARDPFYIGALSEIDSRDPSLLAKYERTGEYIAMPKLDGMWVRVNMNRPAAPNQFTSRTGKTQKTDGKAVGDLPRITIPQKNIVLAGELLASTQWSTKEFQRLGYRRVVLFDAAIGPNGENMYETMGWWSRYLVLKNWWNSWSPLTKKRLCLVEAWKDDFQKLYDREVAEDREGIMLWRKDQRIQGKRRADGKVNELIKCKKLVAKSYVLLGVSKTDILGETTGNWGLYRKDGKLLHVLTGPAPELDGHWESWVGRVADFEGFEVFRSGSMRSAQFKDWRNDVSPEECIF